MDILPIRPSVQPIFAAVRGVDSNTASAGHPGSPQGKESGRDYVIQRRS